LAAWGVAALVYGVWDTRGGDYSRGGEVWFRMDIEGLYFGETEEYVSWRRVSRIEMRKVVVRTDPDGEVAYFNADINLFDDLEQRTVRPVRRDKFTRAVKELGHEVELRDQWA
jgi:hypothetical protein